MQLAAERDFYCSHINTQKVIDQEKEHIVSEKGRKIFWLILGIILALLIYLAGVILSIIMGVSILHTDTSSWGTILAIGTALLASSGSRKIALFMLKTVMERHGKSIKDFVQENSQPVEMSQKTLTGLVLIFSFSIGIILLGMHIAEPIALLTVVLAFHGYIWFDAIMNAKASS